MVREYVGVPGGDPDILRYAAFTDHPDGGNPAGVVLDAIGMGAAEMQAVAARVGYSETAFLVPSGKASGDDYDIRYFTPQAEVPFCGHATIAAAVALAERDGPGETRLRAPAGRLALTTEDHDGRLLATFETVPVDVGPIADAHIGAALDALRWHPSHLDSHLPPRIAFAGSRHLILAAGTRERLSRLDYDYEALAEVARRLDLITVALIWRRDPVTFQARNAGPAVGIREDPATGSAAAALGAYLSALGELASPGRLTVHQGEDMGRPSRLLVRIDPGRAGVLVSGTAVAIPGNGA